MKLYSETKNKKFQKLFELNKSNKEKKVLYMIENTKLMQLMLNKIKKDKHVLIKKNTKVSDIFNSGNLKSVKINNINHKYNLVIICAGSKSNLVKSFFKNKNIESSYGETSVSTILRHESIKNDTARQFFLNEEILALLPLSKSQTSIVWSVKNNNYKKKESLIKEKIKYYTSDYLKKIKFVNSFEYKDLNFLLRSKYYEYRTLLFGDALHVVHPLAGQGFNMTLRDLYTLEKVLRKKINLGLDLGSVDALSEFSNKSKPRNFIHSIGIDLIKNTFSLKNASIKEVRDNFLKIINKNNFIKNLFFDIADKGLKF
jgi:2-octaprenyl-6-methoxyphenol hydroxylase